MPSSGLNIDTDRARLFKCQEMLRHTGLAGAYGQHDVTAGRRAVCSEVPEDFISRPIPKGLHSSLDVGRPRVVVRFRKPWHKTNSCPSR